MESSHLGVHLLPAWVRDAQNLAMGKAPCDVRPAAGNGHSRELDLEACHDAFAMVCAAEPWHDLDTEVLERDDLDAVKYKLNASVGLLLLAEHVHRRAVSVRDPVNDSACERQLLPVVINGVRPNCDEEPSAVVQLVLSIDVQHKFARHLGELSDPKDLVHSREDDSFDTCIDVIVIGHRIGGERFEFIK